MKDMTVEEISALIRTFDESDWKELALQVDDFRVFLSRDPDSAGAPWLAPAPSHSPAGQPAAQPAPTATEVSGAAAVSAPDQVPDNCVVVQAPNLGIFYRAPKPGALPYVEPGAAVDEETEICLIEVMKLFTPVHAGVRGTVRHICVEDGDMVEHGQPLFYIEPGQ